LRKNVISLNITLIPYQAFVDAVLDAARKRVSAYACFANVHMVVEAINDSAFAESVNRATWATADGVPLMWALRFLYKLPQERITGLDVLPRLLTEAATHQLPVYFYGSTPGVLDRCAAFCQQNHPTLPIAGMHSPPFRPLTPAEEQHDIDVIRASGASMVFVALGCPKQEKWMAAVSGRIPAVLLGIGGALPVLIGDQLRSPRWMQQAGLEWLFRLIQEPRRLFRRYFYTNTLFVGHLLRQRLTQR
jgi:N-acetylglucosaminyldiphosphoundecaprenol N-acetyl-beta-D-mannosaminyltransferase